MTSYTFKGKKRIWTPRDEEENRAIFSASRQETGITMPREFKPICDGNTDETEKWNINLILRLLRFYSAHPCLYQRDGNDRNRKLRKAALADIAEAMGSGLTSAQVAHKINVLRATYRYEKRRIKQRIAKGIGAKTKLKWFALADSFLRSESRIGKPRKQKEENDNSNLENEMVFTVDPATVMSLGKESPLIDGIEKNKKSNTKWSRDKIKKFLNLMKDHPILWSKYFEKNSCKEREALKSIADEMQVPVPNIEKRFHKFQQTWIDENEKILNDANYRPPIFWWSFAESFMNENQNFVDSSNAILEQGNFIEVPDLNLNPLPSNTQSNTQFSMGSDADESNIESPTKLIWNGLEDDLLEGKWSLKHSVKFLRLYGAHPCLWNLNDPDYRSRELRSAAIEDIAAAMGFGLNADYVAKKIKIFRITYMQHRKRMLEAAKNGKKPEIQLRWFPLADSFLRPHIGLRSIREHELEIPQFDYPYVMANLNLIDPELLHDFRFENKNPRKDPNDDL